MQAYIAERGSVILILSVYYVREPWLNRLTFSENNITTNYPGDVAHCTTLLIDLTMGAVS